MYKNSIYTYVYNQPEDYKFSLDSVYLAQTVANKIKDYPELENLKVLDLCAGCGVIGLELLIWVKKLGEIDFVEVQNVYEPFFTKNQSEIKNELKIDIPTRWLNLNYQTMLKDESFKEQYDLIISNPPYFFKEEGIHSPNEFKNRCRFFIDSTLELLIETVLFSLKPNGAAYLLLRPGHHHGRNLVQEVKNLVGDHAFQVFDNVRGTMVVEIIKKV